MLEDAGLPRPPSQDVEEFAILDASAELMPGGVEGDVVFVTAYDPAEDTTLEEVPDDLWMLGIGYTAAKGVVDGLNEYLVEKEGGGS